MRYLHLRLRDDRASRRPSLSQVGFVERDSRIPTDRSPKTPNLATKDHRVDTPGIPYVQQWIRIEQHEIRDLAAFDGAHVAQSPHEFGRVTRGGLKSLHGRESSLHQ